MSTLHLTLAGLMLAAATRASDVPAQTQFRDAATDRVKSDGFSGLYGNYPDSINCIIDHVDDKSGFYFLRTVRPSCGTPAVQRAITLDFAAAIGSRTPDGSGSDLCHVNDAFGQTGELNICASNTIVDVRIIGNTLFRNTALTQGTTVTIPFSLVADFSGTAFSLEFEQPLQVSLNASQDPKVRVLTAPPGAIAELYKNNARGRRISLGRFHMEFQAVVSR